MRNKYITIKAHLNTEMIKNGFCYFIYVADSNNFTEAKDVSEVVITEGGKEKQVIAGTKNKK